MGDQTNPPERRWRATTTGSVPAVPMFDGPPLEPGESVEVVDVAAYEQAIAERDRAVVALGTRDRLLLSDEFIRDAYFPLGPSCAREDLGLIEMCRGNLRRALDGTLSVSSVEGDDPPPAEAELPADLTLADRDKHAVKFRSWPGQVAVDMAIAGRICTPTAVLVPHQLRDLHEWLTRYLHAHDHPAAGEQSTTETGRDWGYLWDAELTEGGYE